MYLQQGRKYLLTMMFSRVNLLRKRKWEEISSVVINRKN